MKIGIYKITNLITDQCYIGKSIDINRRWGEHKRKTSNHKLREDMLTLDIKNFAFSILEECSEDKLSEREKHWINKEEPYYNVALVSGKPNRTYIFNKFKTTQELHFYLKRSAEDNEFDIPLNSIIHYLIRLGMAAIKYKKPKHIFGININKGQYTINSHKTTMVQYKDSKAWIKKGVFKSESELLNTALHYGYQLNKDKIKLKDIKK